MPDHNASDEEPYNGDPVFQLAFKMKDPETDQNMKESALVERDDDAEATENRENIEPFPVNCDEDFSPLGEGNDELSLTSQVSDDGTEKSGTNRAQSYEEEEEEEDPSTVLRERQLYDSIADLREAARRYARRRRFAVVTLRSGERQVILTCKHAGSYRAAVKKTEEDATKDGENSADKANEEVDKENTAEEIADKAADSDPPAQDKRPRTEEDSTATKEPAKKRKRLSQRIQCPFQIKAKPAGSGQWIVHKIHDVHNHQMATDVAAYAQHRKFSDEVKRLILEFFRLGAPVRVIAEYLEGEKGMVNVVCKDISNVRTIYVKKRRKQLAAMAKATVNVEDVCSDKNDSSSEHNAAPVPTNAANGLFEDLEPLDSNTSKALCDYWEAHKSRARTKR